MMKKILKGAILTIGVLAAGSAAGAYSHGQPSLKNMIPQFGESGSSTVEILLSGRNNTDDPFPIPIAYAANEYCVYDFSDCNAAKNMQYASDSRACTADAEACAAKQELYDMLSPRLIEFYEKEIAGSDVISGVKETKLERTAKRLGISVQKLKAVYLLQDLAMRNDVKLNINDLAKLSDGEFIRCGKQQAEKFASGLTPDKKESLKSKFTEMMKK